MPFKSARQRRYMFAVVPDAAKKWAHGRETRPSDWRKRKPSRTYVSAVVAAGYKDSQRRDGEGKWTDTGGRPGGGAVKELVRDLIDASDAFKISDDTTPEVRQGVDAVSSVHKLPAGVPQIPLDREDWRVPYGMLKVEEVWNTDPENFGRSIEPRFLSVRAYNNEHQRLTAIHEVGHFVDLTSLGRPGLWESEKAVFDDTSELRDWWMATFKSRAYEMLTHFQSKSNDPWHIKNRDYITYSLDPKELWARSYAQWVTSKRPKEGMSRALHFEMESFQSQPAQNITGAMQWDDDDFKPIGAAIDKLMESKGWLV